MTYYGYWKTEGKPMSCGLEVHIVDDEQYERVKSKEHTFCCDRCGLVQTSRLPRRGWWQSVREWFK